MKLLKPLFLTASLGFCSSAFAGTVSGSVASSPDAFNQWNVEATMLYMASEGEYYTQDHEFGYRLGLSYQPTAESFGYRLSYMDYKGTHNTSECGPELDVYDLEVFKNQSFGNLDLTYSLGARYLGLFESYSGGSSVDIDYAGIGPVAGIEATYALKYGLSAYGNFRTAFTFGSDGQDEVNDQLFMFQVGYGIKYDFAELGLPGAYTKVGYEFQDYIKGSYGKENAEIDGLTVSIGYSF